jgi:AAA family ATP:ADP antiporter
MRGDPRCASPVSGTRAAAGCSVTVDSTSRRRKAARAGEGPSVALAFGAFFLLLCGYYVLRPVRDEMGVQTGVDDLQWLFTGTFAATLLAVPVFGLVVKRLRRAWLLPAVYGFFVVNLLMFHLAFLGGIGELAAAAFFIWVSVFNLFVVSLFWSNVSDVFSTEQSHRLYGYIAAGGTSGALAGPAVTAVLAQHVAIAHLLGLSALLLTLAAACTVALRRRQTTEPAGLGRPIGGSILAGVPLTLTRPSLRGIALLVICYSAVSTVLYIELLDLAEQTFADSGARTAFFATVDLAVNGLTLTMQLLGTRQIVRRFGLKTALSAVPLIVLAGLGVLTAGRSAILVAMVQTAHRAGDYALMRPGREMIYTTVDPESRYKAKSFIDTAVYRANDAASAWLIAAVRGAGLDAVLWVAAPVAALWFAAGFLVGRRHDRHRPP